MKRGRPRLYDWPTRFRRKEFTMRSGKDYVLPTDKVVQQARIYASTRGFRVGIVQGPKGDRFTVTILRRKR